MAKRPEDTILMASSGRHVGEDAYDPAGVGGGTDSGEGEGLWRVIDDRIRGRWRLMFIVGLILAVILAPAGYLMTEPLFESQGIVHVKPEMNVILRPTPETGELALYPQFVATQATKIESQFVLQSALKNSEELRQLEWAADPNAVQRLSSGLSVEAPRNSQVILVTYASESALEAQVCVNAILEAFILQADDVGNLSIDDKLTKLENHRVKLGNKLAGKRSDFNALTSVKKFTTTNLEIVLNQKVPELEDLKSQLQWIRVTLAINPEEEGGVEDLGSTPTGAQLDAIDPELASFRQERDSRKRRFDQVSNTHGDRHPTYKRALDDLQLAENALQRRERAALEAFEVYGSMAINPRELNANLSRAELLIKQEELTGMKESLAEDVRILGGDIQRAEAYRIELASLQVQIAEVDERLSALRIETTENGSRISIFQTGMRPVEPARDRRKPLAVLGAMGGFGMSFAFFFVLGTLDKRAYRLNQLGFQGSLRCLGVLPDLGRSLRDPEAAEMAAHCVHQIRNLIEATRPKVDAGVVIAISSPFQGDGKTSIALALGFSYAAAGNRTLVVDGDLVGRGLTRQLSLVGASGFKEVIRDGTVNGEIVTLNHQPGSTPDSTALDALPVGNDVSIGPQGIRRSDMETMFDQLRRLYDIVIVDTGPVLGSLECIPIVSATDGVVLSVRRGRQRTRLDECLKYLQSVGAVCYGVVLNCAARSECHRYVSEASLQPTRAQLQAASHEDADGSSRENVLVSAMHGAEEHESQPWQ